MNNAFTITYLLAGILFLLFFLVMAVLAYPGPKELRRRPRKASI